MSDKIECRFCGSKEETRHLPLYVCGSEGLYVCHYCEMSLVEYVRGMISVANRAKNCFAKRSRTDK